MEQKYLDIQKEDQDNNFNKRESYYEEKEYQPNAIPMMIDEPIDQLNYSQMNEKLKNYISNSKDNYSSYEERKEPCVVDEFVTNILNEENKSLNNKATFLKNVSIKDAIRGLAKIKNNSKMKEKIKKYKEKKKNKVS